MRGRKVDERKALIERIQLLINNEGLTIRDACERHAVKPGTYYGWLSSKPKSKQPTIQVIETKKQPDKQMSLIDRLNSLEHKINIIAKELGL